MFKLALLLIVQIFCSCIHAASYKVEADELIINGNIYFREEQEFLRHLSKHSNIKKIVFDKCLGGEAGAAIVFYNIMRRYALDTIVKGQCHSACALAFLAGKNRTFDPRVGISGMLFHMPRAVLSSGQLPDPVLDQKILLMMDEATGKKFRILSYR